MLLSSFLSSTSSNIAIFPNPQQRIGTLRIQFLDTKDFAKKTETGGGYYCQLQVDVPNPYGTKNNYLTQAATVRKKYQKFDKLLAPKQSKNQNLHESHTSME